MKIGDKIKIRRKRKVGEVYYDELANTKTVTVIGIHKDFVVVQYEKRI